MVKLKTFLDEILAQKNIYIDSNIFIYLLEDTLPYVNLVAPLFEFIEKGQITGHTSSLTILEINVKPYQLGQTNIAHNYTAKLKTLSHLFIHDLSIDIADQASQLRAKYKLKTPDAIHIASAMDCQCQALLGNDKGFKKIKEISYLHLGDFV